MQPGRKVKWKKWRHVGDVTIWEAVALSLDIDPSAVEISPTSWMAGKRIFHESEDFNDRVVIATRNLGRADGLTPRVTDMNDQANTAVRLDDFAAWATSLDWEVPPEFAALADDDIAAPNAADHRGEMALDGKGRISALKLILGMALAGYRYDPKAARSDVPKEIADDLERHGISITDDTVRKWLRIAAEEVDWQSPTE